MKKIFLIPLLTLCTCVMAWGANVARIGDTNYTSFNTAFAAATEGQTIVLLANIEKAGKAANELRTVSCNITIDGQGQYSVSRAFQVSANKTLTLKDVTVNTTTKPSPAGAIILNNGATLVMNNAKIAPATAAILPVRTVQGASGTIQLVGTTNEIRNNGGSTFYVYNQTAEDNTSTLTITGEGKLNAYHTGSAGNLLGAQANKGQYQINADVTFHAGNTSTLIGANAILPDDLLIVAFSGENAGQYKLIANTDEAKTANGVVAVFGKIAYTSIENPVARITFSDNRAAIDCPDASALHEAVASLPTDGTVATVSLLNDIDGGVIAAGHSLLSFPAETKSILDLNGHILSAQLNLTNYDQRLTIHVINNFGELTINDSGSNGTIKNSFDALTSSYNCMSVVRNNAAANMTLNKCIINNGAMGVDNYGKLTINEDVRIEVAEGSSSTLVGNKYGYTNGGCALDVRNGSITIINGGFIKSHAFNAAFSSASAILAINGGDFYGVDGFGWLHDGMTYKTQLVISGGSFDLDPYDYVDQYHYAALDNDRYVINELAESDIYTVYTFNELKESLNLATQEQGVYVTLGADITVPEMVTLKHGSRLIIPAGRTLTVLDGGLFVNEGRTLCEGTIATIDNGFFSKPASVEGNGTLSISNLSISIDGDVVTYQVSNGMQLQYLSYLASLVDYEDKTWNISLTTDINLPEEANFEKISYIHGTIEGNNHAINNLTMNSKSDYCSLINYFEGTFQNVTLNNVNIATGGLASGLFIQILPNSEVKNVTVNGSITSSLLYATGFVSSEYQQDFSGKHLRFVNCVNNATITSAKSFAGGFFGTISSSAGTIGFYNCANNGAISGAYAGAFGAYGCGADLDVIAFTNTGTITGTSDLGGLIGHQVQSQVPKMVQNGKLVMLTM